MRTLGTATLKGRRILAIGLLVGLLIVVLAYQIYVPKTADDDAFSEVNDEQVMPVEESIDEDIVPVIEDEPKVTEEALVLKNVWQMPIGREPVYDFGVNYVTELEDWRFIPGVEYILLPGDSLEACTSGAVSVNSQGLYIKRDDVVCTYAGEANWIKDQQVAAGQVIGEVFGECRVRISVRKGEEYVDPEKLWQ